ncbi:NmrA family NAD(P)-binding protein [Pseudonocardia bannensis]|uniref:NmrA family NAD(P)-binding protein n=1 Tax=Pseudonocardia bannensis TaxID=630973 RepID=A0A848DCF1_9PSEU|nr:NmrA family NAD(P)-binding protein [Pseudonocardia bannensis]NMH90272.1 NmrA family NAD(P)-binding protein [Pseudonocardia bannensis]
MILVIGATGFVGHHVVEELADMRAPSTAMVRVPARAQGLPSITDYITGTLDDPPPAVVLQQFDRVFLMSPTHSEQVALETTFIDALLAAGHRPHIVKLAWDGFDDPSCRVRFMHNHRLIAEHIEAAELPVTYIAPNLYMENLLDLADTIRDAGLLSAPAGEGRVGFVASSDVGAVAARALLAEDPAVEDGEIHVVTGPESLGYDEVAARISSVFAREVDYDDQPPAETRRALREQHIPEWNCEGMLELYDWIRHGGCDTVTDDVAASTGENARPLEHWLNELRGAFVGRPQTISPPRF